MRTAHEFEIDEKQILVETDLVREARAKLIMEAKAMGVEKSLLSTLKRRFREIDKALKPEKRRNKQPQS